MKIIKIKGPGETQGPGYDDKFLPGGQDLKNFENLLQGCGGTCRKYGRHVLLAGLLFIVAKVCRVSLAK